MQWIIDHVLGAPAWLVYVVVGLVVFVEDALFIGFVVPGETLAVIGGVTASLGHTSLGWMLVVVAVAAIVGDSVGYEVGRLLGPRILSMRILERRRPQLDRAQAFLRRRGGAAVFFGRWTAFFRAVMPALAGVSRMHYPKFLLWNAIGGLTWSTAVVLVGYVAGRSYSRVEQWFGRGTAGLAALVVIVALVVWQVRRRRAERAEQAEQAEPAEPAG